MNILFISFLFLSVVCDDVPQKPIIGIYTQDAEDFLNAPAGLTYIAASYVKNIEMAGGQVVPIFYHSTEQQL